MILYFIISVLGLIIGSFLNVVIYRIPRKESIVFPPSHCPLCNHKLAVKDNIPLLSFLLLKGRCRYCQGKISWQYPLIEATSGALFLFSFINFGLSRSFFAASFFLFVLLVLAVIDLQKQIIPNRIILPAIVFTLPFIVIFAFSKISFLPLVDRPLLLNAIFGFILGGGLLFLIALVRPGGMGGGDLKLAAFMGLFLGRYVLLALFLGFLAGALLGIFFILFLGKSRKDLIPFGPFLALGAALTLFFGEDIFQWYLRFSGIK